MYRDQLSILAGTTVLLDIIIDQLLKVVLEFLIISI